MTWDTKFLYIGVTDNNAYVKNEPTIVYLDTLGSGGSANGFDNYDGRKGALPFTANTVIYFKDGYAELRRDSAGTWKKIKNVVTDSVKTGAKDIEIKLPWSVLIGINKPPANFGILFFKENGNPGTDAYQVRPGVNNKNDNSTGDVSTTPFQLFYHVRTENKFYSNLNVFSWIDNKTGNLCTKPVLKAVPETLKRDTSVRLNWDTVPGAKQYVVRRRKSGTVVWVNTLVPGRRGYLDVKGLT